MGGRETRGTSYMGGRGRGGGGWWRRAPPLLLLPPPYTICWPGHRQLRGMVRPWTSTEVGIMQWPMLVVQLLAAGGVGGREAAVRRQHTAARTRARQQGWVASSWQLLPRPSACRNLVTSPHLTHLPPTATATHRTAHPSNPATQCKRAHRREPTGGRTGSAAGPCRWPGPGW